MQKKVSVLTPCYNGENYIDRYFQSLLNQTYNNFEIIFVDDGSTDKTKDIVKEYVELLKKRNVELVYIYQENGGQASAINNGLKYVKGDYLIWPDADDYYEIDALEILANELENNNQIAYIKANAVFRDEDDLSIINIPKPLDKEKTNYFDDYVFCTSNVCCFSGIVMIRFEKFKIANNGLDIYKSKGGQNWQMLLPVLYYFEGKYIDKNVYNYVVRKNSHSHSINGFKKEFLRTYELNDILKNVIKKIDMPMIRRSKYLIRIYIKYLIVRLYLVKREISFFLKKLIFG